MSFSLWRYADESNGGGGDECDIVGYSAPQHTTSIQKIDLGEDYGIEYCHFGRSGW